MLKGHSLYKWGHINNGALAMHQAKVLKGVENVAMLGHAQWTHVPKRRKSSSMQIIKAKMAKCERHSRKCHAQKGIVVQALI